MRYELASVVRVEVADAARGLAGHLAGAAVEVSDKFAHECGRIALAS